VAVYAIGDVQGCYDALQTLLARLDFNPADDQLWFCGDLVNRGPGSLETLRFVRGLGDRAVCVLGNHDLHLLAVASGARDARPHKGDTLDDILHAPDRDELLHWLRARPLAHRDGTLDWMMVHAGLPPQWTARQALTMAAEVSVVLRSDEHAAWFERMYGNTPDRWTPDLDRDGRLRFTVNCLTRMRYCDKRGRLDFRAKGPPGSQPAGLKPWFAVPERRSMTQRILFGHWSALGRYDGHNVLALDTGCVWGGCLTAARLDTPDVSWTDVSCAQTSS
jgi:bis(5'-nucleosyl)-tetraphosphatase (symmetrical)